ncbi:MAG: hypothetical protein SXQ77_13445 [Halobacteria archaeon]|nr:hypothetical protein [Halobacteria archaeon]
MSNIPNPDRYDDFDQWVFATTNQTGIDPDTVLEIASQVQQSSRHNRGGDSQEIPMAPTDDYVTREEYQQFQRDVREVIESFIDFMLAYELVSKGSSSSPSPNAPDTMFEEIQHHIDEFEDDADSFFDALNRIMQQADGEI